MFKEKIVVNGRFLNQSVTGVQRVACELLDRLKKEFDVEVIKPNVFFSSGVLGHLWEQFYFLIFRFRFRNCLLISFTNTGPICISNQILIIHDAATLDNPDWFSKKFAVLYKLLLPLLAKRVKRIVTVSEFSKQRISKLLKVEKSKVSVIKNGVSQSFFNKDKNLSAEVMRKFRLTDASYFLSVASIEPRKNIDKVIQAWLLSGLKEKGYKFVFAGGGGNQFSKVERYQDSSIIWLGYVDEDYIYSLYQNAQGFVYMSLYEGFGLPPLEAMAAGVPVLTSNTTAIPEITGAYALLKKPESLSEIIEGLLQLEYFDEKIVKLAVEHAKSFTWDDSYQQFKKVLETC